MKILRILAGLLVFFFIMFYIVMSNIYDNWFDFIGTLIVAIPFLMYALRGNQWLHADKYFILPLFKKVNKKNLLGPPIIDRNRFKIAFGKNKRNQKYKRNNRDSC